MVKELRERTGAGVKECKDILSQTNGNMDKAIEFLRERGLKVSDKVKDREANEGRIEIYIHNGAKMAAMVEINCETDFVARTPDYMELCKNIAMHVAAVNPKYVSIDQVSEAEIAASGLTAAKYHEEVVLLKQPFVRNPSQTIEEMIQAAVAKLRENVVVRRFTRCSLIG
jgi:elongation factor Ts